MQATSLAYAWWTGWGEGGQHVFAWLGHVYVPWPLQQPQPLAYGP